METHCLRQSCAVGNRPRFIHRGLVEIDSVDVYAALGGQQARGGAGPGRDVDCPARKSRASASRSVSARPPGVVGLAEQHCHRVVTICRGTTALDLRCLGVVVLSNHDSTAFRPTLVESGATARLFPLWSTSPFFAIFEP